MTLRMLEPKSRPIATKLRRSAKKLRAIAVFLAFCLSPGSGGSGTQLFEGSWMVKAFGNEVSGGTGDFEFYSAFGMPQGVLCNRSWPRCDFDSTPTDGNGNFAPLAGAQGPGPPVFCAPWYNFGGMGTTMRPAKGETLTTGGKNGRPIPPLYRNPAFFTPGGKADRMSCTATSRGATPGEKGLVQAGKPLTGKGIAQTTGTGKRGFQLAAAPSPGVAGIRGTRVGEFAALYPYLYSYTYATLRNDVGVFGPGKGPGSFDLPQLVDGKTVARITVKQGAAKFGGTMKMLGQLTTKVCYYRAGGCSLAKNDWLYDWIGTAAYTSMGVVTKGRQVCAPRGLCYFYSTGGGVLSVEGSRFPWTTGSVTVTATGRGPHDTVHYAMGYDNRTPTSGKGVMQLVSPTMTRWRVIPWYTWETAGIAILRIRFMPEPRAWLLLAAGISALAIAYRWRSR